MQLPFIRFPAVFYQTREQRNQLLEQIAALIDSANASGKYQAKANCPIDTSSLYESIRVDPAVPVSNNLVVGELLAGGVDYRDRTFVSTGKQGNLVDYAESQNTVTGFLDSALPTIYSDLTN